MASIQTDLRLFGLDLRRLGPELSRMARSVRESPLLSWLTPEPWVRLRHSSGQFSVWQMGPVPAMRPGIPAETARWTAIEVPQDLLLQRELRLPALTHDQIQEAAALEVQSASPFSAEDLVWGYCRGAQQQQQQQRVVVLMASRQQLQQHLQSLDLKASATPPELWALPTNLNRPVVLSGFGEHARLRQVVVGRRWNQGLFLLALLWLGAIALTPAAQLYLQARQAQQLHAELVQRSAPAVSQRELLLTSIEQLKGVSDELSTRIDPLRLIEALTQALPDDTSVHNLKLQGRKVTLSGLTANASSLMQLLGALPGLHEVRAPTAATRAAGAQRESFVLEFSLDPASFAVQATALEPSATTLPSSPGNPGAKP
jgi:general secretion pathway protein L